MNRIIRTFYLEFTRQKLFLGEIKIIICSFNMKIINCVFIKI